LHDIVKTGVLGKIVHADATRAGRFPGQVKPGNHVILDLAVHELDVLRLIFGPLMILHSFCHATTLPGIFDTAEIMAATPEGMSAAVHVNWLTPQRIRQLRLTGTEGVVELDYIGQGCT